MGQADVATVTAAGGGVRFSQRKRRHSPHPNASTLFFSSSFSRFLAVDPMSYPITSAAAPAVGGWVDAGAREGKGTGGAGGLLLVGFVCESPSHLQPRA